MATGKAKQRRIESLHLVCLAMNSEVDVHRFLLTGQVVETVAGKPLELSPELEEQVQQEVERIRRENPDLPQFPVIK
jgi:hypothetical protein